MTEQAQASRVSTGIAGLDEVLHGGFLPGRSYLLRGGPGAGKTLLGCQFLAQGVRNGETSLLITLEETAEDLISNAASAGIDLEGVEILDLSTDPDAFQPGGMYDVYSPEEVEVDELTQTVLDTMEDVDPERVFLDPVTLLRHLTPDSYRFRKQVLGLARTVKAHGATLLVTSQPGAESGDFDLQFVTDGTIELDRQDGFRTLDVPKFRGSPTKSGPHGIRIDPEGVHVYPRLSPGTRTPGTIGEQIPSGIQELDKLLHGGLERGTATIISGPSGAGKTTLGSQFMKEAASRGERSSIYLFEENADTFLTRSEAIGTPVHRMMEEGTLAVEEIEAIDKDPHELAQMMRADVEEDQVRIVMIDGIAGYRMATGGVAEALMPRLHALVRYLKNRGVTVLLIDEIPAGVGFQATEGHVSYLADNVVFLRHVELDGKLRKVIGILKKRVSDFDPELREMKITADGIVLGEPLQGMRGVLSGAPERVETRGG